MFLLLSGDRSDGKDLSKYKVKILSVALTIYFLGNHIFLLPLALGERAERYIRPYEPLQGHIKVVG